MLAAQQFKQLFPNNKQPEAWTAAINTICPADGINTPMRLAQFLAQCGHESQGFTHLIENLNYSAEALAITWPNRYAVDPKAKVKAPNDLARKLARNPEAIGNNCYANRNGNGDEASGDGYKLRGHGPLQTTGRANLERLARRVGKPLDEALEYILTPEGGITAACLFWTDNNLNRLADTGDTGKCTRIVNGGYNGLAERAAIYKEALRLLQVSEQTHV